jgi:flagellin-like protein
MVPVPAFWLKVSIAFGLAFLAVTFLPGDRSGATPPVSTLLTVAVTIALVTTVALWLGLRLDLGFPTAVIVYTIGWNVLVILAKFAVGPRGFYEVNQEVDIDASLPTLDDPAGAFPAAMLIFALYAGTYWLIYRGFRGGGLSKTPVVVGSLVVGAILLSAASGTFVLLLLPLLFAAGGLEYLHFVFTSSFSLVVGLMLAGAVTLAIMAFRSAAEQARVVGDAAILVSLFWVGLAFLAIYHALWVVYVLVLTSIWPLKTVTPK